MTIRAVPKSGPLPESPYAAEIRAIAERAIAQGAVTFFAVWEDAGAEYQTDAIPPGDAVRRGFYDVVQEWRGLSKETGDE